MNSATASCLAAASRRWISAIHKVCRAFAAPAALLIALLAFVAPPILSDAFAQHQSHSSYSLEKPAAPLIDGSTQPELVPDNVAIRALLETLPVPSDTDPSTKEQLRTRIARAGLSEADMAILAREVQKLDARVKYQEGQIASVRPSSDADSAAIARYIAASENLNSLFVTHYQQLVSALSPDGAEKVKASSAESVGEFWLG